MSNIKCPECGNQIPTNAKACQNCGWPVPASMLAGGKVNTSEDGKINILGIISGIVSIIGGIVVFTMDGGSHSSSYTYGGDAYTGIQNASADAANNICDLINITRTGFALVLIVLGLALIAYFAKSKVSVQTHNASNSMNVVAPSREETRMSKPTINSNTQIQPTTDYQTTDNTKANDKTSAEVQLKEIDDWKKLLDTGVINEDEFEEKKKGILSNVM
jgi:hypothetical protein